MSIINNFPVNINLQLLANYLGVRTEDLYTSHPEVNGEPDLTVFNLDVQGIDQATLDALMSSFDYTIEEANTIEELRVAKIKSKASSAILAIADEVKQRNMIARELELTNKIATGAALTVTEQAESDVIKSIWSQIKTIRDASNQAEINGTLADNFNP